MPTNSHYLVTMAVAVFFSFSPLLGVGGATEMVFPGAEWEKATPESQWVDSTVLQEAVDYLRARSPSLGASELVVVRNGRIIWEGYRSGSVGHIWSATKSFATTVLGLLVDDGVVTVDTLAIDYVPSMATEYSDVSLHHLATHTSGYRAQEEPYPIPVVAGVGEYQPEDPFTPGPPLFAPGSQFYYSPETAMDQMMNVLTRAAGEPMQDLFQRRIGDPIGLDPTSWDWGDYQTSDGIVVDSGGAKLHISARDAARFGHLFLNRGDWNGQQLISDEWVEEATSVQVPLSVSIDPESWGWIGPGVYGYGWWLNSVKPSGGRRFPGLPPGLYEALGARSNRIFVVPEWDMVISRGGGDTASINWNTFLGQIGLAFIPHGETLAISPDEINTVTDDDSNSVFDDRGDTFSFRLSKLRGGVGELDSESSNGVSRMVAIFDLPGRASAARFLASATLRFFLEDMVGTPAGPVSVFHSVADNVRSLHREAAYEDPTYDDTLLDLVQPTDAVQMYYEVDVTDLVILDYTEDGDNPTSAFRLQINEAAFAEDNQSHRYRFTMPGAEGNHPELVLTFIPEPTTLMLATLAILGLLWRRKGG